MGDYYICHSNDYVSHHGILGMKWGVRRYQNPDGSYTAAGRARYFKDVKARGGDLKKAQIKWDKAAGTYKSDHQLKLEAKYKKKGLTAKQAEEKAKRTIKAQRAVAIGAGITAGVIATGVAVKKYKEYSTDKIIGGDENPIWRVELNDIDNPTHRKGATYGIYNEKDKKNYQGVLAQDIKNRAKQQDILTGMFGGNKPNANKAMFNTKLTYNNGKGIKLASEKNSRKTFNRLMKNDPEFRNKVNKYFREDATGRTYRDTIDKMNGIASKKSTDYDAFITSLNNTRDTDFAQKFFGELRKQGYGAVNDVNDNKYSGYARKGKSAVIAFADDFKADSKRLNDADIEKMGNEARYDLKDWAENKYIVKPALRNLGIGVGAGIATKAALSRTNRSRAISLYNSGYSQKQIAKQLGVSESEVSNYLSNQSKPKKKH